MQFHILFDPETWIRARNLPEMLRLFFSNVAVSVVCKCLGFLHCLTGIDDTQVRTETKHWSMPLHVLIKQTGFVPQKRSLVQKFLNQGGLHAICQIDSPLTMIFPLIDRHKIRSCYFWQQVVDIPIVAAWTLALLVVHWGLSFPI